jgi:hypothetical protein
MTEEAEQTEIESVLDTLESDLRRGMFARVDEWLRVTEPAALFPATVLAALSITFWGKHRLHQRDAFLERAERSLVERLGAERAERLLEHRR